MQTGYEKFLLNVEKEKERKNYDNLFEALRTRYLEMRDMPNISENVEYIVKFLHIYNPTNNVDNKPVDNSIDKFKKYLIEKEGWILNKFDIEKTYTVNYINIELKLYIN
jgi:hypothetical protein